MIVLASTDLGARYYQGDDGRRRLLVHTTSLPPGNSPLPLTSEGCVRERDSSRSHERTECAGESRGGACVTAEEH
eukprot:3893107-Rhodomonas_salina.1